MGVIDVGVSVLLAVVLVAIVYFAWRGYKVGDDR